MAEKSAELENDPPILVEPFVFSVELDIYVTCGSSEELQEVTCAQKNFVFNLLCKEKLQTIFKEDSFIQFEEVKDGKTFFSVSSEKEFTDFLKVVEDGSMQKKLMYFINSVPKSFDFLDGDSIHLELEILRKTKRLVQCYFRDTSRAVKVTSTEEKETTNGNKTDDSANSSSVSKCEGQDNISVTDDDLFKDTPGHHEASHGSSPDLASKVSVITVETAGLKNKIDEVIDNSDDHQSKAAETVITATEESQAALTEEKEIENGNRIADSANSLLVSKFEGQENISITEDDLFEDISEDHESYKSHEESQSLDEKHDHQKTFHEYNEKLVQAIHLDFKKNVDPKHLMPHLSDVLNPGNQSEIEAIQNSKGRHKAALRMLEILKTKDDWFEFLQKALCRKDIQQKHVAEIFLKKRDEILRNFSSKVLDEDDEFQDAIEFQTGQPEDAVQFQIGQPEKQHLEAFVYIATNEKNRIKNVYLVLKNNEKKWRMENLDPSQNNIWTCKIIHYETLEGGYYYSYENRKTTIDFAGHKMKQTNEKKSDIYFYKNSICILNIEKTTDSCLIDGCSALIGILFSKVSAETLHLCENSLMSLPLSQLKREEALSLMQQLYTKLYTKDHVCDSEYILLTYIVGGFLQKYSHFEKNIPSETAKTMLQSFKDLKAGNLSVNAEKKIEAAIKKLCHIAYPGVGACVLTLMDSCYPALRSCFFNDMLQDENRTIPVVDEKMTCEKKLKLFHSVICRICPNRSSYENMNDISKSLLCSLFDKVPLELSFSEVEMFDIHRIHTKIFSKLENTVDHLANRYDFVEIKRILETVADKGNEYRQSIIKSVLISFSKSNTVNIPPEQARAFSDITAVLTKNELSDILNSLLQSKHKTIHDLFLTYLSTDQWTYLPETECCSYVIEWFETSQCFNSSNRKNHLHENDLPFMYSCLDHLFTLEAVSSNDETSKRLDEKAQNVVLRNDLKDVLLSIFHLTTFRSTFTKELIKKHLDAVFSRCSSDTDPLAVLGDLWHEGKATCKDCSFHMEVIITVLEYAKLKTCENFQESFAKIMKTWRFWIKIFPIENCVIKGIHQQPEIQMTTSLLCTIAERMVSLKISCSFVRTLQKTKDVDEKIKNIYDSVKQICNKDVSDIIYGWNKAISVLKETDQSFELIKKVLENLKQHSKRAIPDIDNAMESLKLKEQCYMDKGNIHIVDFENMTFWEMLKDVKKSAPEIEQLSNSDVFWNVCQDIIDDTVKSLQDIYPESEIEQYLPILFGEMKPESLEKNFVVTVNILDNLKKDGIKKYSALWQPYFDKQNIRCEIIDESIINSRDMEKELDCAEKQMKQTFVPWIKIGLLMLSDYKKYQSEINTLQHFLNVFKIDIKNDADFSNAMNLFLNFNQNSSDFTLKDLHDAKEQMDDILGQVKKDVIEVIRKLAECPDLVEFLLEIVDEDVRNLINIVEEYSEHQLHPSTVSTLMHIKSFVSHFRKKDLKIINAKTLFKIICDAAKCTGCTKLLQMITETAKHVSSLRSLFHNVASHTAVTKEVISMLTVKDTSAVISFSFDAEGTCLVKVKCQKKNRKFVYSKFDISDFRIRALLLINTAATEKDTLNLTSDSYRQFINYIDNILQISSFLERLHQTGHEDYVVSGFNIKLTVSQLKYKAEELKNQLEIWENIFKKKYEKFFWLCYFHPQQLWKIKQCLKKGDEKEYLLQILHFTGFQGDCFQKACELFNNSKPVKNNYGLSLLGNIFDKVLQNLKLEPRSFPGSQKTSSKSLTFNKQLQIVSLEQDSNQVIPVLMTMYKNTTKSLPFPHQVLFCHEVTTMEEINLIFLRCRQSSKRNDRNKNLELYCIAMVEKLPNSLQFSLANEIKQHLQQLSKLVLICRGQTGHPFLEYFSDYVCRITPMEEEELSACYEKLFPMVFTVTSEVPGLGKTTFIEDETEKEQSKLKTVYINGNIDIKDILKQLEKIKLQHSEILHISVELVTDPMNLDLLIYQMIILKTLSHQSSRVYIQPKKVFIEIANTVNNCLQNSLFTTRMFKRKHIKWENFSNYKVSADIKSAIQVVCHYVHAMETSTLNVKDLHFEEDASLKPLHEKKCQEILVKYFSFENDSSFTLVNIALNVLAEQLKRMSLSTFFQNEQLQYMHFLPARNVKDNFLKALLKLSKEFAKRSVNACRNKQQLAVRHISSQMSADALVKRMETGLIRWEDSNHLLIAFNNHDQNTVSFIYRKRDEVPRDIKELYKLQERQDLPDLTEFSPVQLQQMLQRIVRKEKKDIAPDILEELQHSYAITLDNFLKMVLICQRIDANIPVIMMGETGCGKTSVIKYLSEISGIEMEVFNFHAGIDEKQIVERICSIIAKACSSKEPLWLFLDEINTSCHLGLITSIMCHRICYDHKLPENVALIAACNPYKLRTTGCTSGLQGKIKKDAMSDLIYRVHPLPENMMDYVWDFGTVGEKDEYSYIQRMVRDILPKEKVPVLVQLLAESQRLIRQFESTHYCVSLREIDRCRKLIRWFSKIKLKGTSPDEVLRNSVILSLAHTYYYRISEEKNRREYRNKLINVFKKNSVWQDSNILKIISESQADILNRMHMPEGIAKNSALKENVFVVLVCILNKMPVFLVGKQGSSKSLSLQLIKDNLKGKDSENEFFKTLPELYFFTYQGSEMSTSDGITRVFEKAKSFLNNTNRENVLPVVILDEVGLAENSRFHPLKVLHSLLEPEDAQISVVGISNWALDPAKMNRVIHVSRPDLNVEELEETGHAISVVTSKEGCRIDNDILAVIAQTYCQFIKDMSDVLPNFHGLRDFYSLVKYIAREINKHENSNSYDCKLHCVLKGLQRNFGGNEYLNKLIKMFSDNMKKKKTNVSSDVDKLVPVIKLIEDNIKDSNARNLMVITEGDAVLGLVENILLQIGREYVTIIGSQFQDDIGDEYNYRILSKIILYMEQGKVLILNGLEQIYGSLYDMLNQNYTSITGKNMCRIALGPYSNSWCHVHENFRCIVIVDGRNLTCSDPPFLNRFEKQTLRITDVLNSKQREITQQLEDWITDLSKIEITEFKKSDLIPVYGKELVPSLVYSFCTKENAQSSKEAIFEECKNELISVCTSEGVIRGKKSILSTKDKTEYASLQNSYFELTAHKGLGSFINSLPDNHGQNIIVLTHTNIHENFENDIQSRQVEHMAIFKCEKELSSKLEAFWSDTQKKILIFHSLSNTDGRKILHFRTLIENQRKEYLKTSVADVYEKHVVIILHLGRATDENLCFINFLSGWKLTTIDNLVARSISLEDMYNKSIYDILGMNKPLHDQISKLMFWAFTCIRYSNDFRTLDNLHEITESIKQTKSVMHAIEKVIWHWLENNKKVQEKEKWQFDVAVERCKLLDFSTFMDALDEVIISYIKHPLSAVVHKVEVFNAWNKCYWQTDDSQKTEIWINHLTNTEIVDISEEPLPSGPECFYGPDSLLELKHPFSKVFFNQIEDKLQKQCMKECQIIIDEKDRDYLSKEEMYELFDRYLTGVKKAAPAFFESPYSTQKDDYFDDFCIMVSSKTVLVLNVKQKITMLKQIINSLIPLSNEEFSMFVTKLHITYWLNKKKFHSVQHLVDACMQVQSDKSNEYFEEFTKLMEANKDQENNFESTWSRITKHICQELLRSTANVNSENSCRNWQRNTNMILTHADEVSEMPVESHALSLCIHFADLIVISHGISEQWLVTLGGQLIKNDLVSKKTFHFISEFLQKLEKDNIPIEYILQFYSFYVRCCFAADPDTEVMEWVLDTALSKKLLDKGNYHMFGPALHLAIRSNLGLNCGPQTLSDIIKDESSIGANKFFVNLDKTLKEQGKNSSLGCICTDIFHHFFVDNEIKDEDFRDYLSKFISSEFSLSQTIAVACIKYQFEHFSRLESQNIFKEENIQNYGIQVCFIEYAVAGNGFITFNKLCKRFKTFDVKQENLNCIFDLNPLGLDQQMSEETEQNWEQLMRDAVNDGSKLFDLFSFTLHRFLFSKIIGPLSEENQTFGKKMCKKAEDLGMSKYALKLLRCLCCQDSFHFSSLFNFSEESEEEEFQMSSFLIHVMCCCLTNSEESLIFKCLVDASQTARYYLPAVTKSEDEKTGLLSLKTEVKTVNFFQCSCRFISAVPSDSDIRHCTACTKTVESDKITEKNLSLILEDTPSIKGYIRSDPNAHISATGRTLSPVTFRFLNLVLHACFAGSLALGFCTKEDLAVHLNLGEDVNVEDYLRKHLSTHWNTLRQMTALGNGQVGTFLHLLLQEMKLLLQDNNCFETPEERQFFEDSISKKTDEITRFRFSKLQDLIRKCTEPEMSFDRILHESGLNEDKFPMFLRYSLPPTNQNMKSEFVINMMEEKHPFLALVFAKENQLSLLYCLLSVVKWHLFCFKKISYKKTRNECKQLYLLDFIDRDDQKEYSEKLFVDFKKSWITMRSKEKLLKKYNKNLGSIPQITMNSTVEDCIIVDKNSAMYQILVALKNMQNEFLEDALIISLVYKSLPLSFMKSDKSANLSVFPIEEITEKEIVHWTSDDPERKRSETILKFSQCCSGYDHGRVHSYDYYSIDHLLSDYLLVNKPFLEITDSFPIIVFLGDCLYRSVTPFEDIENFVQQKPISEDMKNTILTLKCQSHSNLRIILEYLETIFALMKKVKLPKNETDYTVKYYITQWSVSFLQRSPEVEHFLMPLKLCFLTSLFEFVEGIEADTAITFLDEKFKVSLKEELKTSLGTLTEQTDLELLEGLLAALKRFAYRFINDPNVHPGEQLGPRILQNQALWPCTMPKLYHEKARRIVFHPDLCVEHIKCTVQYLSEFIEKKRGRLKSNNRGTKQSRRPRHWNKKLN